MSSKLLLPIAFVFSVLSACAAPAAPASPGAQTQLLAVSGTHLYAVSLTGKSVIHVAATVPPVAFADLARNPISGAVYGVTSTMLYRLDLQTGAVQSIGNRHMKAMNALAFNSRGELFAGDEYGTFFRIDASTGVATQLNEPEQGQIVSGDLAFAPDGTLYATMAGGSTDRLVTVDTVTGSVTPVGLTGVEELYGLSFTQGVLYGMSNSGQLVTLNTRTGAAQLVWQTSLRRVYGLE